MTTRGGRWYTPFYRQKMEAERDETCSGAQLTDGMLGFESGLSALPLLVMSLLGNMSSEGLGNETAHSRGPCGQCVARVDSV